MSQMMSHQMVELLEAKKDSRASDDDARFFAITALALVRNDEQIGG